LIIVEFQSSVELAEILMDSGSRQRYVSHMTKVFPVKLGRRQLSFRSEQVILVHNAKKQTKILNSTKRFSDVTQNCQY